jgi:hypothetical protein
MPDVFFLKFTKIWQNQLWDHNNILVPVVLFELIVNVFKIVEKERSCHNNPAFGFENIKLQYMIFL